MGWFCFRGVSCVLKQLKVLNFCFLDIWSEICVKSGCFDLKTVVDVEECFFCAGNPSWLMTVINCDWCKGGHVIKTTERGRRGFKEWGVEKRKKAIVL